MRWISRKCSWLWQSTLDFPVRFPKVWSGARAVVTQFPSALMAYMAWKHRDVSHALPAQDVLKKFFEENLSLLVVMLLATPIISITFDIIESVARRFRESNSLEAAEFSTVLSAIDEIVGVKQKRIGRLAAELAPNNPTRSAIFERITHPESQISEIIEKLFFTLKQLTNDDSLKIVLVAIENCKPIRYVEYMPSDSKPDDDLIQNNGEATLFGKLAVTNKELLISDIATHVQTKHGPRECNYYVSDPLSTSDGSIMGIPLYHPYLNSVVYALTIKSASASLINKAFKKKYGKIVKMFTARILFEHSLLHLKNHSH